MKLITALAFTLELAACASGPVLPRSATLPEAARVAPRNYIVVTVRNPLTAVPTHAASTARGYDGAVPYLASTVARAQSRALAKQYGLAEVSSWPIAVLGVHCLVYGIGPDLDLQRVIAVMSRDARVDSVQPLQAFATQSARYNDPYAAMQRNLELMSITAAHGFSRGAGVRVAIIDTGVDTAHPDLRAGAARTRNFVDTDAAAYSSDIHGTAVAGVIAAVPDNGVGIVGIAPDVELLIYKACWRAAPAGVAAVCNTFTLAQALAAAIEARADVINLSLAGPSDALLTRLVRRSLESGAIVVGAVPPDHTQRTFPTDVPGVIAVASLEDATVDAGAVRAPGRDVLSLAPAGHYEFFSGSSLATAEISGVAALLRAAHPRLAGREVVDLLSAGGSGMLGAPDACAALVKLMGRGVCPAAGGR